MGNSLGGKFFWAGTEWKWVRVGAWVWSVECACVRACVCVSVCTYEWERERAIRKNNSPHCERVLVETGEERESIYLRESVWDIEEREEIEKATKLTYSIAYVWYNTAYNIHSVHQWLKFLDNHWKTFRNLTPAAAFNLWRNLVILFPLSQVNHFKDFSISPQAMFSVFLSSECALIVRCSTHEWSWDVRRSG